MRTAKKNRPEQALQIAVFKLVLMHEERYPELKLLFHPPNGGKRTNAEAGIFKAMGVRKGVPDFILPVPRRGYTCLVIELKAPGELDDTSDEQLDYMFGVSGEGGLALAIDDIEIAWQAIEWYVNEQKGPVRTGPHLAIYAGVCVPLDVLDAVLH